jgi:hypothetical protein
MGLAISVGYLNDLERNDAEGAAWFRENLKKLSAILEQNGLPAHQESVDLPELGSRAACDSFPYSFLHYLRRVYAHAKRDSTWRAEPLEAGHDPTEDDVLDEEMFMFESHLLNHSDAEGYYVPQEFEDVIYADTVPGGMTGSSQHLLRELIRAASALGITLENGELSDAEAERINSVGESDTGLYRENTVWITMFEAARLSIKYNTLIVFS